MRAEAALTNSDSHAATQQQETAYSCPDQACICTSAGCHGHAQAVLQSGFCRVLRGKVEVRQVCDGVESRDAQKGLTVCNGTMLNEASLRFRINAHFSWYVILSSWYRSVTCNVQTEVFSHTQCVVQADGQWRISHETDSGFSWSGSHPAVLIALPTAYFCTCSQHFYWHGNIFSTVTVSASIGQVSHVCTSDRRTAISHFCIKTVGAGLDVRTLLADQVATTESQLAQMTAVGCNRHGAYAKNVFCSLSEASARI